MSRHRWNVWTPGPEPVVDIDTPLSEIDPPPDEVIGTVWASLLSDAQRMAVRIVREGVVVWAAKP